MLCFACSDLHGRAPRYRALLARIEAERPRAVFLAGDLLPMPFDRAWADAAAQGGFLSAFLFPRLRHLRARLGEAFPRLLVVLGNDDPRAEEPELEAAEREGLLEHVHGRWVDLDGFRVAGYACVPPTPFQLKDWERYDVSRFVDPGCVSPEKGLRTVPVKPAEIRYGSIKKDLEALLADEDLSRAMLLFHSPPHGGKLDLADLAGKTVEHVPVDPHVGSIAIQRLIEARNPRLTLHGHVHESTRLTGSWRERIGSTWSFQAAHDGPELALIRFEPDRLDDAERELIAAPQTP